MAYVWFCVKSKDPIFGLYDNTIIINSVAEDFRSNYKFITMLDLLIHAAIHRTAELIGESEIVQKLGNTIDDALNNGVDSVNNSMKRVGNTLNKSAKAANEGVKAAINSYKNSK